MSSDQVRVRQIKVLTRTILKKLNNKARRLNLNRTLSVTAVNRLPADKVFPITWSMLHNDDHIRVHIVMDDKGGFTELDMTLDDFDRLPTMPWEEKRRA